MARARGGRGSRLRRLRAAGGRRMAECTSVQFATSQVILELATVVSSIRLQALLNLIFFKLKFLKELQTARLQTFASRHRRVCRPRCARGVLVGPTWFVEQVNFSVCARSCADSVCKLCATCNARSCASLRQCAIHIDPGAACRSDQHRTHCGRLDVNRAVAALPRMVETVAEP